MSASLFVTIIAWPVAVFSCVRLIAKARAAASITPLDRHLVARYGQAFAIRWKATAFAFLLSFAWLITYYAS